MGGIETALAEHAFEHLFIECLGWDRFRATVAVGDNHRQIELTGIAQKRGFSVFVCHTHRTVVASRQLLRQIQRQLRKSHHEHILIHYCEAPRKQVWQWACSVGDGRRILHREHPFFSDAPPPRLLQRLSGLAVSIDDEERTTLTEILQRVRSALLPDNEFDLFSKHPSYAAKSDRLAIAMSSGDADAFSEFVQFHMPLARQASRMLVRWFQMDSDDAEQTAMIGLIEASRRFDPERGFQFSTYAGYWIRQCCQRYGLQWGMQIRVPPHVFWRCYRLTFERTRLIATLGERDGLREFEEFRASQGISLEQWNSFWAASHVDLLSEIDIEEAPKSCSVDDSSGLNGADSDEVCNEIQKSLRTLPAREAEILRLRYGIGEREHTLQEAADLLGITRERVRQIQVKAEERLERRLATRVFGEPSQKNTKVAEVEEAEESMM